MRDIKFRAWDTGINFMYYDPECYIIYNEEDNGLHSGYKDKFGTWYQNKLMQYTGLKDKNGKEIYEGDIVKVCGDRVFEIVYSNGCFNCKSNNKEFALSIAVQNSNVHECDLDVIGNIYENKELLEGE